jgi:Mrp family chromosome partitioning ATPase
MTDLAEKYGPNIINAALHATENMNGLGELAKWPTILENSFASYEAGIKMEKMAKKLQEGQVIDWSQVSMLSRSAQMKLSDGLVRMSEVEAGEIPFVKTGMKSLDDHTGGIPKVGLVVVGGRPGVGKTWFMVNLSTSYAKLHTEETTAIFSLEMLLREVTNRYKGDEILDSHKPTEEEQQRLFICERPMSGEEIIQACTTIPNLGLVCIDFADLAVPGEVNEGSMSLLYKTLALGAKELGCAIILFAQLNGSNGIPKPSNLRWTRLSEAFAWMVIMLYDPASDWTVDEADKEDALTVIDNSAYIIVWKVRGGFRLHRNDAPGAICVPFSGRYGWHLTKSKWFTLKKYER